MGLGERRHETGQESPSLGGLETQVGFLLRLAQVAVFKDLITELKPYDLRPTDFSVLLVIEATPGLKQQEIGDALRIQRPNVVNILDQLQARGLVLRGAVPGDRRSYALTLTPEGRALLIKAKAAHARHDRKLSGVLAGLDKSVLIDALERIAAI